MDASQSSLQDLFLLVKSRFGLICIDSEDERRTKSLISHLADRLGIPLFHWTTSKGLRRSTEINGVFGTTKIEGAFDHIEQARYPAIYHFDGLTPYLEDRVVCQKLKDASQLFSTISGAIIITGPGATLPPNLSAHGTTFSLPLPEPSDYRDLLIHLVRDFKTRGKISVQLSMEEAARLLNALKGLTLMEAEKILTKVIIDDGVLNGDDIQRVLEAKKDSVAKDGVLEYLPVEASMAEIADLKGLKSWLSKRKEIIQNPERAKAFGLTFPKGVLLLGVQGCGKSLCAKAVSMEWGLPLLKFDTSNLYNKYIGESEKNFKRATMAAEKMAPVILWIDEIEKAFASSGESEDGGVSLRILGTFLNWMQERTGDVFIIATANNIDRLPPEFLRKGRFDEIFFVDLPNEEALRSIFEIHLRKRKRDPAEFDLDRLVKAAEGFSGAEVAQAIVSALYTAFSSSIPLTTDLLLKEISVTRPISAPEWLRQP